MSLTHPAPGASSPASRPGAAARERVHDALVVGAGFAGLGAALTLAEAGADVVLCERLRYPGGCASTFERDGFAFDAGATLLSGFAPHQLFARWVARHGLPLEVERLAPLVELRTPARRLDLGDRPGDLERALLADPTAPHARLRRFFRLQRRVADALWEVVDRPELLPPLSPGAWWSHVRRAPRYLPLARLVGRPLGAVLERFGLTDHAPLRVALDALCQITVQCAADRAEAPFALAAMDYLQRGTVHVRGGVGELAEGLCRAVADLGGQVRLADGVQGLEREGDLWRVTTRRGVLRARAVLIGRLPRDLAGLLPPGDPAVEAAAARALELAPRVEAGWGACMLYRVVRVADAELPARHLQLVRDEGRAFVEGNHLFASLSGPLDERDPEARRSGEPSALRTLTVSTHLDLAAQRARTPLARAQHVARVQQRLRDGLAELAPEWGDVRHELTASPRTFERFTGRSGGLVGGIPRTAGLAHYRQLGPLRLGAGLWAIGDSVFPGQSALASATGGVCAARDALARLGARG